MKIRRSLLKDQADASTYLGESPYGASYGDPVTVWCNVDETRRLVRDANGDEAVSEVTLQLHPATRTTTGDTIDPLQVFTPETQVVVNGRTTRVLTAHADTFRGRPVQIIVTCA